MRRHERIELSDNALSAAMKLSEGNPGAMRVCAEMMTEVSKIDPGAILGPIAPLLSLDSHGIYGDRIWMLYNDACQRNVVHTLALLRSVQMGLTPESTLNAAIDNRGDGLDMVAILSDLQQRLPNFAKQAQEG